MCFRCYRTLNQASGMSLFLTYATKVKLLRWKDMLMFFAKRLFVVFIQRGSLCFPDRD